MDAGSITLRASNGHDLDAVDAMLSRTYPKILKNDYAPSVMVTAVPIISRANPALLRSGTYYVAEDSRGAILGAGGWTLKGKTGEAAAEVRHLVVDWRVQRRGLGRRLMMGVFAEAKRFGIGRLDAQATLSAAAFYEAMGFEALARVNVPLRPGIEFPAVMMRRFL
jgi:GNAT superfamily N-acetyltransferase